MTKEYSGKSGSIVVVASVGLVVMAALWWFKPEPEKRPYTKPGPPAVEIVVVSPESYQSTIFTQGTVEPKRKINLVSEVSGRVVEVSDHFVSGGSFNAGDMLIRLDDRDYRYALASAEAQVASAERELALEKGQARQAKRVWRDLGSQEANALFLREPQLKAAQSALKAAQAEQRRAALNVERTVMSIPFAGRVEVTQVDLGQFVPAGSVLGVVFDSQRAEIRLPLSGSQLAKAGFSPGASVEQLQTVLVTLSADIGGQRHQWQGRLTRVEPVVDTQTRFFHVIAEVDQPFNTELHEQPLVMGLFVEAHLTGKYYGNVIALPKKALNNTRVFVVDQNQRLSLKDVTVIDSHDDTVWVQSDLQRGDRVVVSDPRVLQVGQEVKIKSESSSPVLSGSSLSVKDDKKE